MISRFHYITQDVSQFTHHELAERACVGGVDWVQLRLKNKSDEERLDIAIKTRAVCQKHHAKFIINDHVMLAKAVRADGVHLGKTDMPPHEARTLLGGNYIIGGTANTFEDIEYLVAEGVDYIGLGPFRFTSTKENLSPILGLEGYDAIINKCKQNGITIPIIAIGGIQLNDVQSVMNTGVYGIAVSSGINLSEHKHETAKYFLNKIKVYNEV